MKNWYVLQGKTETGPYTYEEVLTQLQSKRLFDHDYVWNAELPFWTQLKDVADFSTERIALRFLNDAKEKTFERREFPRTPVDMKFYGHNDIYSFEGKIVSLSEKGALAICNTRLVEIGDPVLLFFFEQPGITAPFKITANILNKKPTEKVNHFKSLTPYCIGFSLLKTNVQALIKDLVHHT
ncbi:MAG: GYF domain-containing protein [Bdellovibrionota bacterium]